jgi:hypothetical protein
MGKHRLGQVDANPLQGLPLSLIDTHGKGEPDGELSPLEDKRLICAPRCHIYPREQCNGANTTALHIHGLNHPISETLDNESRAVREAPRCANIPQQDTRSSFLQQQPVWRER